MAKTAHFVMHRCAYDASEPAPGHLAEHITPAAALFARAEVWVGVMTPKRWAKRSVTRHLIKRQVYAAADAYAQRLAQGPTAAYVVRQKQAFDPLHFVSASSAPLKAAVRSELMELFAQTASHTPQART